MGSRRVGWKSVLALREETQQTERMDVGETKVSCRGEARTDVADLNVARKFDELAHDVVGWGRSTVLQRLELTIAVDRLKDRIKGFPGRLEKRNDHFVHERYGRLKFVVVNPGHGCLESRPSTRPPWTLSARDGGKRQELGRAAVGRSLGLGERNDLANIAVGSRPAS